MKGINASLGWHNFFLFIVLLFVLQGCAGSCTNTTTGSGWSISAPDLVIHSSPSTRVIKLTLTSGQNEVFVQMSATNVPAGWGVSLPPSPIQLSPGAFQTVKVEAVVTIPAGETPDTTRFISFVGEQTSGDGAGVKKGLLVNVKIGAAVTQIREVTQFTPANHVFECLLEVSWGQSTSWGTLMYIKDEDFTLPNFNGPGDAVVWFTPKSGGLSLDPGDVEQVTIKVLPTTNLAARKFNWRTFFGHTSGEYGVNQSFTSIMQPRTAYEIKDIDYAMGVSLNDPDKTTSYTVEFTRLLPGRYTFALQNLPGNYSATLTPPFVDVSTGDIASVRVDVTRIADGSFENTEEFVLKVTHSSASEFDNSVRLPIQSWRGR